MNATAETRVREKLSGIYAITVTVAGARHAYYVGSSVDMHRRRNHHWWHLRHGRHSNTRMQRVWNRHGEVAFAWELVALIPAADMIDTERRLLGRLCDDPACMNAVVDPITSLLGRKQSPEHVAKRAAALKGTKPSEQCMAASRAANTGRRDSEVTRAKKRAAKAGCNPVWAKEAVRAACLGKPFSPERRANISAALRARAEAHGPVRPAGWKHTPETREKLRAAWERRRAAKQEAA